MVIHECSFCMGKVLMLYCDSNIISIDTFQLFLVVGCRQYVS